MHIPKISLLFRWNMMSCCGGASRRTGRAIEPRRHLTAPPQAAAAAGAGPPLHPPTWRWSLTASSPSTKRSSRRFSTASKRPGTTSATTEAQSRAVALPDGCIITALVCLSVFFDKGGTLGEGREEVCFAIRKYPEGADAKPWTICNPLTSCHFDICLLLLVSTEYFFLSVLIKKHW